MALKIPVTAGLPHSRFSVVLDGTTFSLEFRWNERAAAWFWSVYDASGTLLIVRKLVLGGTKGFRMLARFRDRRLPAGDFVAVDTSKSGVEPGLYDLGARVQLLYVEAAELRLGAAS